MNGNRARQPAGAFRREPFNGLTPAEAERLAQLIEEAGEVVQIGCKILRHGYDSCHPHKPGCSNNRLELAKEVGDLIGVLTMMIARGDISQHAALESAASKPARAARYHHHQRDRR